MCEKKFLFKIKSDWNKGAACIYKLLTLILIRESLTEINSKIRENKKIPTRDENQNPKLNQQY